MVRASFGPAAKMKISVSELLFGQQSIAVIAKSMADAKWVSKGQIWRTLQKMR
jgi:hypothetical protein